VALAAAFASLFPTFVREVAALVALVAAASLAASDAVFAASASAT
jgi:hypothetical protein